MLAEKWQEEKLKVRLRLVFSFARYRKAEKADTRGWLDAPQPLMPSQPFPAEDIVAVDLSFRLGDIWSLASVLHLSSFNGNEFSRGVSFSWSIEEIRKNRYGIQDPTRSIPTILDSWFLNISLYCVAAHFGNVTVSDVRIGKSGKFGKESAKSVKCKLTSSSFYFLWESNSKCKKS